VTHPEVDMTWRASTWLLATVASCGTSDAFLPWAPVPTGGEPRLEESATITSPAAAAGVGGFNVPPASAGMGGAAGSAPTPSAAPSCKQTAYSLAVRLTIDTTWDETLALMAGAGKLYSWSKLTIEPSTSTVREFRACGSLMPVYHGTAVAGSFKSFQRVPTEKYDLPSMPFVTGGSATRLDTTLTVSPGPLLLGLTLPDPSGPWPASPNDPSALPVDADADGEPGLTSWMRNDDMFTGSPTSILQTERIDAMYMASRLAFRATLDDAACADTLQGTAELMAIDTLFMGCHVKDRGDCRPEELAFFEENRPRPKFSAAAVVHAVVIPIEATCAQALQALEIPGP
jgi:hypothetical protein